MYSWKLHILLHMNCVSKAVGLLTSLVSFLGPSVSTIIMRNKYVPYCVSLATVGFSSCEFRRGKKFRLGNDT